MCVSSARLDGRTVIVTGGSSGVGFETAKLLAQKGARVIIASRNEAKLKDAAQRIQESTSNPDVAYRTLDLASLASVRSFVQETVQQEPRLDALVNNVGAIGLPDAATPDGLHVMMQVNYFGAFLLTYLLLPLLKVSAPSRIVNVAGGAMYIGAIDFEHLNDVGYWSTVNLLSNSKLATALFSVELSEELKGSGVTSNTYDPFLVSNTDFLKNLPEHPLKTIGQKFVGALGRSKMSVANELVFLASDPSLEGVSGRHYKFCGEWFNSWLASDKQLRRKLWDVSKALVDISGDEDWDRSRYCYNCIVK